MGLPFSGLRPGAFSLVIIYPSYLNSLSAVAQARHVKHRLEADVVEGRVGDHGGGGLRLSGRVARRVPGDVDKQGVAHPHPLQTEEQVDGAALRPRREELKGEEFVARGDPRTDLFDQSLFQHRFGVDTFRGGGH